MVQSVSIARYIARSHGKCASAFLLTNKLCLGLAGKNNQEAALADMVVDGVGDVRTAWYQARSV
jgi:hypothetical protein